MAPTLKLAVISLVMAGCAPYMSYTHLSNPRIKNDGYDLMCAGGVYRKANLEASAAGCYNAAPMHGEFLKVEISYVWDPNKSDNLFAENRSANDKPANGARSTQVAGTADLPIVSQPK